MHSPRKAPRLDNACRQTLRDAKSYFYEQHSHFDIELALTNFDNCKLPVAKEVVSLISSLVKFARKIDEAAIRKSAPDEKGMCAATERILVEYFEDNADRRLRPWAELSELCQGKEERRRVYIENILKLNGITENDSPISPNLPGYFVDDLAKLEKHDLAERFKVPVP